MDELPDYVFTADKRLYGKLGLNARARAMRHESTEAENVLWQELRAGRFGAKFRRQHPIDRYIVDFVCIAAKLIVEAVAMDTPTPTKLTTMPAAQQCLPKWAFG